MAPAKDVQAGPPWSGGATGLVSLRRWRDKEQGNAHALIIGARGRPKTTVILTLVLRLAPAAGTPAPAAPEKGG